MLLVLFVKLFSYFILICFASPTKVYAATNLNSFKAINPANNFNYNFPNSTLISSSSRSSSSLTLTSSLTPSLTSNSNTSSTSNLDFFLNFDDKYPTTKPIALIYKGPGSCDLNSKDGCSQSAAKMARYAGFTPVFVGPDGREAQELWKSAQLWIQPGGRARIQIETMSPKLLNDIREFVRSGGGYVGFCAGGFLATEHFGWTHVEAPEHNFESHGIGLLPGNSRYYDQFDSELSEDKLAKVIPTLWNNKPREVYWELGPYFDQSTIKTGVEVLSLYEDGKGLAVRSTYGTGRVAVTAFHPEAPESWYNYYKIKDSDGPDADIAVDMIRWVTSQQ